MEKRSRIIIVDDIISNLDQGRSILKTFYEVFPAPSAAKLFEILENIIPDLIMLDIEMPVMNGYETIKELKADPRFADIPVIFLTSKNDDDSEMEGFNLGAVDYVTKPFFGPLLLKRIENQLLIVRQKKELLKTQAALKDYADNLEIKVSEKTAEVVDLQNAIIETVADLVEYRDKLTGGHITRTQFYLKAIIEEMANDGVYAEEVANWNMDFFLPAAQLHDVGKIAISDTILNKPTKLSAEEFEIMKSHVSVGVDAIEQIMRKTRRSDFLNHALLTAGTHHEKWDGAGYPIGLKGASIPLEGRLMAIVDVYDALVSERPYKNVYTFEEACGVIEDGAGSHFDPVLVDVFKKAKDKFESFYREACREGCGCF
ncbi:MAG: response regulator [Clostridiales bacterium]|nr:response regulator [Clostridiales bacterium]